MTEEEAAGKELTDVVSDLLERVPLDVLRVWLGIQLARAELRLYMRDMDELCRRVGYRGDA